MKIQIMSDLHLEYAPCDVSQEDVDVVVLAGDIAVGAEGILWAKETFPHVPTIYVCGNHEYHDSTCSMAENLAAIKEAASRTNAIVLDNDVAVINGIRILGTTMWTDLSRFRSVLHCDGDTIVVDHEPDEMPTHFTAYAQQELHERSREWLRSELAKSFDGRTIVVTHHAPSLGSLHQQYVGNRWNDCFITNLEALMPGVDVWVHGHTHNSFDYRLGKTRVVCNPRGYPRAYGGWENPAFNPVKVVEL